MDAFGNDFLPCVFLLIHNRLDHLKDPFATCARVLRCGAKAVVHCCKAMALALDNSFDDGKEHWWCWCGSRRRWCWCGSRRRWWWCGSRRRWRRRLCWCGNRRRLDVVVEVELVDVFLGSCEHHECLCITTFVWVVKQCKLLVSHIHLALRCSDWKSKHGECRVCEIHGSKAAGRKSASSSNNAT